ncbi:MAG TPA: heavy metal translocating P-type ATPase [Streptosporangiaceae bacterium]|nr:heavy metal translocating P-type ATPase [Streptosporangiaceae bacterium]
MTTSADPRTAQQPADSGELLEFAVGGMTCASCAARIERQLNRLDGVTATVSYATERAYVTRSGGRRPADLISVIETAGYTAELANGRAHEAGDDQASRQLGRRLAACVPLATGTIVLAMVPAAQFAGWQWVSLLLAAPVAIWGAWPLHAAAWRGLGHGTATMDTLVSLGVGASFGWSVYALLFGGAGAVGMRMPFALSFGLGSGQSIYLDAAAGVTTAVLAGRYLEARAKARSGSALTALAALAAKDVRVLREGAEQTIAVEALQAGEEFVVRPGEKIATDGLVTGGASAIDAAMVTGESVPQEVTVGDEVTGGTMNLTGRLVVRATRVGADTTLAHITRLVTEALASKARSQRLADKVAGVFVPCVISLAVVTLGFWLGVGLSGASAWSASVAVLVVACPCALGLATPTALMAALGRGAELGILIRSAQSLETAGRIKALVLDKTGTLTTGMMTVQRITTSTGSDEAAVLRRAGAVEAASEHPAGQAIAVEATRRCGLLPAVTQFSSVAGSGVRGMVDGDLVVVGREGFAAESGLAVPAELSAAVAQAGTDGRTAVLAGWQGQARAVFAVGDTPRPGGAAAIARLRRLGLTLFLLTGDSHQAAATVACQLGIPAGNVIDTAQPAAKARVVRDLQQAGYAVAMAGDGVNDAAALAAADLGMAMASGTDAAIGASDLTLTSSDPGVIADAIQLSRATLAIIRINLSWAFGYNVIAIPLAALGYLNPLFAGVAMSVSSLIVVSNSLLLRRFRPRRTGR